MAPKLDPITDEEIERYVVLEQVQRALMLEFRRRVSAGAPITTSRYTLTCEPISDEQYEEARSSPISGYNECGTVIDCTCDTPDLPHDPAHCLELMLAIYRAHQRDCGCSTPGESLLCDLVRDYSNGFPVSSAFTR
jgi:hypothetical protein